MKKIYICSPYSGDVEKNTKKAKMLCKFAIDMGCIPIAPHLYFTRFLDDSIERERRLGMFMGMELMKACDEVWVFGSEISEGMKQEMDFAERLSKPISRIFPRR